MQTKRGLYCFYRKGLTYDFVYYIECERIERVKVIKNLEVTLDEELNFKAHIDYTTAKARSVLGILNK